VFGFENVKEITLKAHAYMEE